VAGVIWKLAGFLARHGQPAVWQLLQRDSPGGSPPPPEVLLEYLVQLLRGQGYLLCFDDVHLVDRDPLLELLLRQLSSVATRGDLALLLITQHLPSVLLHEAIVSLSGLTVADTRDLIAAHDVQLSEPLLADLYAWTEGNAQLMTLASTSLRATPDPA